MQNKTTKKHQYTEQDIIFLSRAFNLAKCGRFTTAPNPNVGCVIVKNMHIIGEGYHYKSGEEHAEIKALRIAGNKAKGSTVYTTLEPCSHYGKTSPCTKALINAGIKRLVSTIIDPNPKVSGQGFNELKKSGIIVDYGLMENEAELLNLFFFKRVRTGLPWVTLKIASSLDGKTAMLSGNSKWITSVESRNDVQIIRAESNVILSTSKTILADNPLLNVRWEKLPYKIQEIYKKKHLIQPIKVIIDSNNIIKPYHKVIKTNELVWLIRISRDKLQWPKSVYQIILPQQQIRKNKNIDVVILMNYLGQHKINRVLVESGSCFAGCLLLLKLVDEIILYIAPKLLGNYTKPLINIPKILNIHDSINFNLLEVKKIGPDIRLKLQPIKN